MQPEEQYSIAAAAALADVETRILKQGDTFGVFDLRGEIYRICNDELGIYHRGSRYLSHFAWTISAGIEPLLLNSHLRDDNGVLRVEWTNPDIPARPGQMEVRKGTIHFAREKLLLDGYYLERISARNYGNDEIVLPLRMDFMADFRDVFEIRGMRRHKRGTSEARVVSSQRAELAYRGLDDVFRKTTVQFEFPLDALYPDHAEFTLRLAPHERLHLEVVLAFAEGEREPAAITFQEGFRTVSDCHRRGQEKFCRVISPNAEMNLWIERSRDDLVMLSTKMDSGDLYPYAGVPWYATPFGRDGIWTALLCLWANPDLSRGVLRYLAETQAKKIDPEAEAEPGKIVHEVRTGEMAALKEVPFGRYYGSIDATPLFLVLAHEYYIRTADRELIEELWPALELAWQWILQYGDRDGDGFLEYPTTSPKGLKQQGWKDSHDSVFHADGSDAPGPIALCEVQAYVYGATRGMADFYRLRGENQKADKLTHQAADLKEKFQRAFWLPELGTLALALDRDKRPCRVVASNAGHALYFGILDEPLAAQLAKTLISEKMFSHWGVRTLAEGAPRFNPMSYHNGSIWPHDNAIIAIGLARYGCRAEVEAIFDGMFHASTHMEHARMPELFCGFPYQEGNPPTLYPVACSPQAWASASLYAMVGALLGVEISGLKREIVFKNPTLTRDLSALSLRQIRVREGSVDVSFVQAPDHSVAMSVDHKVGAVAVLIEK